MNGNLGAPIKAACELVVENWETVLDWVLKIDGPLEVSSIVLVLEFPLAPVARKGVWAVDALACWVGAPVSSGGLQRENPFHQ